MSQENVELLWRINEVFNRGDHEGAFALADPPTGLRVRALRGLIPDLADVQRGPEGLRRLLEVFAGEFDAPQFELHDLLDAAAQLGARHQSAVIA